MDTHIFRPAPYLPLGLLLLPGAIALTGAAIFINTSGDVPVWLPFLALLWVPCLPLLWLTLQSARTNSIGLAAGRPWRAWVELPWESIERVERVGPTLLVTSGDGRRLVLVPLLLREGKRLERDAILRLPPHVLLGGIGQKAQEILGHSISTVPEGGLSGTLRARPARRLRSVVGMSSVILLTLAVFAALAPGVGETLGSVLIALVCGLLGLLGALFFGWLLQEVVLDEKGISLRRLPGMAPRTLIWNEIGFVDHSSRQSVLRLWGPSRLVCAGPALMPRAQRNLMLAFLNEYCVNRKVPVVGRAWIWPL